MPQKATFPALGFTVATTSTFDNYLMVPLAFSTPSHFPFQYELQKLSGSYAECAPSLCSGSIGNLNDSRCCFRPIRPKRDVSRICTLATRKTHSPLTQRGQTTMLVDVEPTKAANWHWMFLKHYYINHSSKGPKPRRLWGC